MGAMKPLLAILAIYTGTLLVVGMAGPGQSPPDPPSFEGPENAGQALLWPLVTMVASLMWAMKLVLSTTVIGAPAGVTFIITSIILGLVTWDAIAMIRGVSK